MAFFALVFGSLIGFFGGIAGWVAFDMSVLSAFGFYLCASLGTTALAVTMQMMTPSYDDASFS